MRGKSLNWIKCMLGWCWVMQEHCPKCGNEIYKPYIYCNACGWEKKEEKKAKTDKPSSEKAPKPEVEKPKKPVKLRCKCGAVIKIKSSKRPLKIKCPKCGKSGTLKDKAKGAVSKSGKSKPEKTKKTSHPKQKAELDLKKNRKKKQDKKLKKKANKT